MGHLLRVIWVIKNCHCEEPVTGFWSGGDVAIARRLIRGPVLYADFK